MKDKATYAGTFYGLYVDIYMMTNVLMSEGEVYVLPSIFRD